jgi:hypothetical protein
LIEINKATNNKYKNIRKCLREIHIELSARTNINIEKDDEIKKLNSIIDKLNNTVTLQTIKIKQQEEKINYFEIKFKTTTTATTNNDNNDYNNTNTNNNNNNNNSNEEKMSQV